MEQRRPRLACYDRMRVIAVLGIIGGCVSDILVQSEAAGGQPLRFTWHLANLVGSATQFAVPLLLMAVGALLLEKEESASLREVMRRRVLYLLIPLAVWTVIYFLFRFLWQGVLGESFVPVDAIRTLVQKPMATHLWVLYLLLAIYLVLPFLRLLVQHAPRNLLIYAVVLWAVYNSVAPALAGLFPALSLPSYGDLKMLGGYLGYPLLGWLLATNKVTLPRARWMAVGWGVGLVITAIGTAVLTKGAGEANLVLYQMFMPNIVLMSGCAFLFCRAFDRPTVFSPWLSPMAQFAFGMYAVHELYTLLLTPLIRLIPGVISLIFAPPLIWLLSLITVAFMRQTKVTRLLFLGQHH